MLEVESGVGETVRSRLRVVALAGTSLFVIMSASAGAADQYYAPLKDPYYGISELRFYGSFL